MIAGKYYLRIGPCCVELLSYSFPLGNLIYTSTIPAYENFKSLFTMVVFLRTEELVMLLLRGSSNRPFCFMRILWIVSCKKVNNTIPSRRFIYKIQGDTKKRELLKTPTKIEEIQEKKLLTEIEPLQLAF